MGIDTLQLARSEFALTASFHYLFVALTLGLAPMVAISQTRYLRSGDDAHAQTTRFWGQIYVVNYALGIVTGIVMEFQFGLNWSGLSQAAGSVFGAPLALETIVAFFIESTFLGLWVFGWGVLPRALHTVLIWIVTVTAYLSTFFILVANTFLQHPVGYIQAQGGLRLTNLLALLSSTSLLLTLGHVIAAALLTGGVFVAGVSAFRMIRSAGEHEMFYPSFRLGVVVSAVAGVVVAVFGVVSLTNLASTQPAKSATLLNQVKKMSAAQRELVAQFGAGNYLPPKLPIQIALWVMFGCLFALVALALIAISRFEEFTAQNLQKSPPLRRLLWLFVAAIPLPFLANTAGWVVREVGRQPWLIYGVLKTHGAVSDVGESTVLASFVVFGVVFAVLAFVDYHLIARIVRRGPDRDFLAFGPASDVPIPTL